MGSEPLCVTSLMPHSVEREAAQMRERGSTMTARSYKQRDPLSPRNWVDEHIVVIGRGKASEATKEALIAMLERDDAEKDEAREEPDRYFDRISGKWLPIGNPR